jgi:hypothetical protein
MLEGGTACGQADQTRPHLAGVLHHQTHKDVEERLWQLYCVRHLKGLQSFCLYKNIILTKHIKVNKKTLI